VDNCSWRTWETGFGCCQSAQYPILVVFKCWGTNRSAAFDALGERLGNHIHCPGILECFVDDVQVPMVSDDEPVEYHEAYCLMDERVADIYDLLS
jgi:hypothetical protein